MDRLDNAKHNFPIVIRGIAIGFFTTVGFMIFIWLLVSTKLEILWWSAAAFACIKMLKFCAKAVKSFFNTKW